jgi:hypothetical protein
VLLTEAEQNQGIATLQLMQSWPNWVHRRVDHISFDDLTSVVVRASLDFTLPDGTVATGRGPDDSPRVFVPLALFLKGRLTGFSLRDESDGALPAVTRTKADRIGVGMLWAQAQIVRLNVPETADLSEKMPERIEQTFASIASKGVVDARQARAWLVERSERTDECDLCYAWRRLLRHSQRFKALSRKLAGAYVLLTPMTVEQTRTRRVIKLEYESPRLLGGARPGPFHESPEGAFVQGFKARVRQLGAKSSLYPYPVYFRTGVVGRSKCYHQEAEVPPGLQFTAARLGLYDSINHNRHGVPDLLFGKLRHAHLHVADVSSNAYGITQLYIRSQINYIARAAWLASGASLVLLCVATALALALASLVFRA